MGSSHRKTDERGLGGLTRRSLFGAAAFAVAGGSNIARAQPSDEVRRVAPPSSPRGQVVVGLSQEPTVFNPLMAGIEVDQGVWWNLFNPLWGVEPDGTFTPQLAREVPSLENGGISADGLQWTVRLRSGVVWHDGTPFTAEDVKFTLDLINNPAFRTRTRLGHNLVRDIVVRGPGEISWRMEKAFAPYLSLLAWTFIVPRHVLAAASDPNSAPFNNAPIGTGPFRWMERVPGDRIGLAANTEYFGEGPHLERVEFKYIPDLTMLYNQLRTGQIDYAGIYGILGNFYEEARSLKGLVISANATQFVENLALNLETPALADKAVRQALYQAINKQAIAEVIYYGLPQVTESFYPRQSWAYADDLPQQSYDIAKANRSLDDAGWRRGPSGVREKGGVRLALACSTSAGNTQREQVQQILVQDWQSIGVGLEIMNMPAAVVFGDFLTRGKYQTLLSGGNFQSGSDPDCSARFRSTAAPARGGAGANYYQYAEPAVDDLLDKASVSFDRAVRREAYRALQHRIRNDLPFLPLYQLTLVEGYKQGIVGYRHNVNVQSNCWNMNTWYWNL